MRHLLPPVDDSVFSKDEDQPREKGFATTGQSWAERCYARRRESGEEMSTRTEWFLLIENLTKNMLRPCVLDLKMGTRQYGYGSPRAAVGGRL
jgi:inositol-hexakisphosphate 5-kinase